MEERFLFFIILIGIELLNLLGKIAFDVVGRRL